MTENTGRGGRGGRGGGRGRGRGRGGDGAGIGNGNGGGRDNGGRGDSAAGGPATGGKGKMSKQEKKVGRRQKQLQAMGKKANEEDAYFRKCQLEARKQKPNLAKDDTTKERENELFGKQMVKGINFAKYNEIKVEVKVPGQREAAPPMDDFSKLKHLTPQLKRNIELMKYEHPTPIQKNALPLAMAGEDLMCCAQTGSGKTCAFLLPVVAALVGGKGQQNHKNDAAKANSSNSTSNTKQPLEPAKPKCVVMAPTRELASQIELEAEKLTHAIPTLQPVVVYGGANPRAQLKELAIASGSGNDLIVVATPGRLTDFVDRNLVSLSEVQYLILDEADRCLDMGFEPQIRKLVQRSGMTPKEKRQTFLFSATFPPTIQKLAAEFLRDYVWIAIGRVGSTTDSITQVLVKATNDKRHKLELVVEALEKGPKGRTLIFVQKKRTASWLKKQFKKGGPDAGPKGENDSGGKKGNQQQPYQGKELVFTPIEAEEIHGDRSQSQRETALEKFRAGTCKVLVATDVAARGLDIPGVEHVINMDLPNAADDFDFYVHRIGRTGRAGNEGLATSLFVPGDDPKSSNGRIASLLLRQLRDSNQEVPAWLEQLVFGGGGENSGGKKPQFTSTDVRKNASRPSKGGKGGGPSKPNNEGADKNNNGNSTNNNNNNPNGENKDRDGGQGRGRGRGRVRGRGRGRGRGEAGRGEQQ